MSSPKSKPIAKLILGIMFNESSRERLKAILSVLESRFGKFSSIEYDFNFTEFYEKEFGRPLKKAYLCFENPFDIEELPDMKLYSFGIENSNIEDGKRIFNIDPGYITKNSVVLASFKERAHRLYIKEGVYADLELVYEHKSWKPFNWTFSDMKEKELQLFLEKARP